MNCLICKTELNFENRVIWGRGKTLCVDCLVEIKGTIQDEWPTIISLTNAHKNRINYNMIWMSNP